MKRNKRTHLYFFRKALLNVFKKIGNFTAMLFSGEAFDSRKYSLVLPEAFYSPWQFDEDFRKAFLRIQNYTLVEEYRCYELWSLVKQVQNVPGDIVEVGVWQGGSGCLIAQKCKLENIAATVYLCDTFKGVVKVGEKDKYFTEGDYDDTDMEVVRTLAQSMGLDNIKIILGVFPDETQTMLPSNVRFRYCHIDVDIYQSAKDIFEFVWKRLSVGGVVVFDDYGCLTTKGITECVDEILQNQKDCFFIHNLNGHAVFIKTKQ